MSAGRTPIDPAHEQAILKRIHSIPCVSTLGICVEELAVGYCRAIMPHHRAFDGVFASYHGGLLMTAADSVACFAIMTGLPADELLTTTDMGIRFLEACRTDATVEATVIKFGRTLCPASVELFDDNRRRVAVAQVTYMRLPRRG